MKTIPSRVIGLIPARGGSRRLPKKNMTLFGKYPLVEWAILSAAVSTVLHRVYISTDDPDVKALVNKNYFGDVEIIDRPEHLSQGEPGSSLNVIRHAITHDPIATVLILLQPSSPFRTGMHIDAAFALWNKQEDSVPVVSINAETGAVNGAIYIVSTNDIRYGGPIYDEESPNYIPYLMSPTASIDIDTEIDLARARRLINGY